MTCNDAAYYLLVLTRRHAPRQDRDVPSVTQYMEAISVHLMLRRPDFALELLLPVLSSYDARCEAAEPLVRASACSTYEPDILSLTCVCRPLGQGQEGEEADSPQAVQCLREEVSHHEDHSASGCIRGDLCLRLFPHITSQCR